VKKRNEAAADPRAIAQDILKAAGATKASADWKAIARAARDAYAKAETSLSECGTQTYFYACAWGGFRGHMGQWTRIILGETKIEDHVQRPLEEPARASTPEPAPAPAPTRRRAKRKPAAPAQEPAAPAPTTISDDDIEAWLREENR